MDQKYWIDPDVDFRYTALFQEEEREENNKNDHVARCTNDELEK